METQAKVNSKLYFKAIRKLLDNCMLAWITLIATVLYDRKFQILEFYMRGRDAEGQERMKTKFADMWR